jgi:catechol 2,3-dioxygenase-like lactoylglutathione lyase family enzyme
MGMRHPREACPPIHACLHDLEEKGDLMKLALVTIVTTNLEQMRTFYQAVLQIEPQIYRGNYIEFTLEAGTLALWRQSECAEYGLGAMRGAANDRILIELEVTDVDREYARFKSFQTEWVQELTTQPWGHRAFYVRDPDGNILNVHMAVEE